MAFRACIELAITAVVIDAVEVLAVIMLLLPKHASVQYTVIEQYEKKDLKKQFS